MRRPERAQDQSVVALEHVVAPVTRSDREPVALQASREHGIVLVQQSSLRVDEAYRARRGHRQTLVATRPETCQST